ncbi:hypothetical protein ACIQTU_13860 [Brevundimonas sp. NPDC090276]|uniref:hypothetical protein n=1 Tax=Brevundimonas sp. NPDC090276 TaxID=3363956 RepID=UPI00383B4073
MEPQPNAEDAQLAELWQAHFGTPMPIYGVPAIARRILVEHGADVPGRGGEARPARQGKTPDQRPVTPR